MNPALAILQLGDGGLVQRPVLAMQVQEQLRQPLVNCSRAVRIGWCRYRLRLQLYPLQGQLGPLSGQVREALRYLQQARGRLGSQTRRGLNRRRRAS